MPFVFCMVIVDFCNIPPCRIVLGIQDVTEALPINGSNATIIRESFVLAVLDQPADSFDPDEASQDIGNGASVSLPFTLLDDVDVLDTTLRTVQSVFANTALFQSCNSQNQHVGSSVLGLSISGAGPIHNLRDPVNLTFFRQEVG